MPEDAKKERKKVVVEEITQEAETQPTIEVPEETPPHVEPGIHEEAVTKPEPEVVSSPSVSFQPPARTGPSPLLIIIPGLFLLGALLGGIVYYQKNTASFTKPETTVVTVQETPATTASPAPTADLTKYEVKILNGSGIAGEAGRAQDLLEKAGFSISSVGNAPSYSFTKSVIQVSSDVEEGFVTKLSESLSEDYQVDTKTQAVPASSEDKVIVIIGSSKK
jgi:hypothetical protein